MSFPTHVASTGYNISSLTSTWTPFTGQNYAGQFLVFFAVSGGGTLTTASSGWVKLAQVENGVETAIFYKQSGAASEELAITASPGGQRWSGILMRFTDADAISGTTAEWNNTLNPDPPSHTASDTFEAIWVALVSDNETGSATAAPSSYTGLTSTASTTNKVAIARRQLEASSTDPGTFTLDSEQQGIVGTFAVYNSQGSGYSGAVI